MRHVYICIRYLSIYLHTFIYIYMHISTYIYMYIIKSIEPLYGAPYLIRDCHFLQHPPVVARKRLSTRPLETGCKRKSRMSNRCTLNSLHLFKTSSIIGACIAMVNPVARKGASRHRGQLNSHEHAQLCKAHEPHTYVTNRGEGWLRSVKHPMAGSRQRRHGARWKRVDTCISA